MGPETLYKKVTVDEGRENHDFILLLFSSKNCKHGPNFVKEYDDDEKL
jgi:hypothetical protein